MVNLNDKTILVTGGAGFIGSNFLNYVLKHYKNLAVVNIDKMGVGSREFIPSINSKFYTHNTTDVRFINLVPQEPIKYDYIFHFAAESHVDRSINSPMDFIHNNVIGITGLLEYMRIHQPQARLINVSTDEVYGHLDLDDPPFTENSPIAPRSPYAASKASADLIANSYHTTYGLDIITTRCCNNYGPWQHSEKFIPTVIRSLKEGKNIPVYGNGKNIREWIYVDDHNKSILEIAARGISGGVYNIGSGLEFSNLDMVEMLVKEVTGEQRYWLERVEFVEDRKGHDFRYAIDSIHYIRGFGLTDFDCGISKTVAHYIK